MEGRITTPPTMSGVHKLARQGKAEGISRPNKAKPSEAMDKHHVNAYGGNATAMHGRKGTWMRTNKKG
jgi:hypothetical protein